MRANQFCVLTTTESLGRRFGASKMHFSTTQVALAAVVAKAVILFLLIYCLMHFSLLVGVMCLVLTCYALLYVHSSFTIILRRKRKLVALLLSCYCKYSVALPHGAMDWSAGCDCGIS